MNEGIYILLCPLDSERLIFKMKIEYFINDENKKEKIIYDTCHGKLRIVFKTVEPKTFFIEFALFKYQVIL